MKQAVAIVGPTASGKTSFAIALAQALDTEIISADSMQFYRGMEIGSGAPSAEELASIRHHFIGFLKPSERFSAGEYSEAARAVVEELNARGKTAVIVGGSGLYIQALLDGMFEGPGADESTRERLEAEAEGSGVSALYERLRHADPDYAAKIASTDLRRIVRGLEVFELSGNPLSSLHEAQQASDAPLDALQFAVGWERADLYARIDARVDEMLQAGWLEEVRGLVEAGLGAELGRLKAIGYRELMSRLAGETELEPAVEQTKMFTRRYAKRQLTWFRGDDRIEWLDARDIETDVLRVEHVIRRLSEVDI